MADSAVTRDKCQEIKKLRGDESPQKGSALIIIKLFDFET